MLPIVVLSPWKTQQYWLHYFAYHWCCSLESIHTTVMPLLRYNTINVQGRNGKWRRFSHERKYMKKSANTEKRHTVRGGIWSFKTHRRCTKFKMLKKSHNKVTCEQQFNFSWWTRRRRRRRFYRWLGNINKFEWISTGKKVQLSLHYHLVLSCRTPSKSPYRNQSIKDSISSQRISHAIIVQSFLLHLFKEMHLVKPQKQICLDCCTHAQKKNKMIGTVLYEEAQ